MVDKMFVATKAFIIHNEKVLILQESSNYEDGSQTGKFGVVGGRIEPGEHFGETLVREVKEETGLDIKVGRPFFVNEWRPEKNGEKWQIVAIFFECFSDSDEVTLSEDHDAYEWINPQEYKNYNIIKDLSVVFESFLSK